MYTYALKEDPELKVKHMCIVMLCAVLLRVVHCCVLCINLLYVVLLVVCCCTYVVHKLLPLAATAPARSGQWQGSVKRGHGSRATPHRPQ